MKIAIPTSDRIAVSNSPRSGFFNIVTFRGENLADIEYRNNPLPGGKSGTPLNARETDRLVRSLADCDIIIGGTRPNELTRSSVTFFIETVLTEECLAINAATLYNSRCLQHQRDTCCSP